MTPITKTYHIKAPVEKVWQALVDPKIINEWSGSTAKMDEKVGAKFELWHGDIRGVNLEVVKHKKLVQSWYSGDWPKPSKVIFELHGRGDQTTLNLTHAEVPAKSQKSIDSGWDQYYFGPLKNFVET